MLVERISLNLAKRSGAVMGFGSSIDVDQSGFGRPAPVFGSDLEDTMETGDVFLMAIVLAMGVFAVTLFTVTWTTGRR
jgi:hypothetical protein